MKKLTKPKSIIKWPHVAATAVLVILLVAVGIYLYLLKNKQQEICADGLLNVQYHQRDRYDIDGIINISVTDKNTNKETSSFSISDVYERHSHFIEIHNCFIYIVKQFGVDYERKSLAPDYRRELWQYNLYGTGKMIFPINGQVQGIDFRVTQDETLVAMNSGIQKEDQIGPVWTMRFIDLATMKEVYHFSLNDLMEEGLIDEKFSVTGPDPRDWTKDSHYLWGDVSVGAEVFYFFRVDTTDWNLEIFEVPEDVFGGTALNIEKGYITRYPGYVWTGIHEITEQVKKEWREQGKISSLYLYNLFTKDDILLATTSEPLWDFKDKWISDTELEYEMPSGEKRVYRIEE